MLSVLAPLPKRALRWACHQPLLIASAVALVVTAGLGALVLAPLLAPSDGASDASLAGGAPGLSAPNPPLAPATSTPRPTPTPTPWPRRPRGPSPTPAPTATIAAAEPLVVEPTATPTARPTRTPRPEPTATATPEPPPALYLAEAGNGLETWGGPNWFQDGGALVNDGASVTAQPWLMAPESVTVEGGYAVEAEFQVLGVASGFCEQNFGVVAVAADGATYLGGGLLYFCDGSKPMVRITDVSNWVDGYNRDLELSSARLDLGTGWHTLRLEVGPGGVRLLIDDKVVLEAVDPSGVAGGSQTAKWGVWSQGVRVAIRRIAVEPLVAPA